MKLQFEKLLSGGDLRSIGKSNSVVSKIENQRDFDQLFTCLFHKDRILVMRAADAIEKITIRHIDYLTKHKDEIIKLCHSAKDKELKWHLALLIPRLPLNKKEFGGAWDLLTNWAKDKTNSRIVRVHSIQGLFDMLKHRSELEKDFRLTLAELENENIPSLNARIRKLKNSVRLG